MSAEHPPHHTTKPNRSRRDNPGDDTLREFGHWLKRELMSRGYVMTARGGGRAEFAAHAGLSQTTVGRLINGKGAADFQVWRRVALALKIPLPEILIRSGQATEEELYSAHNRVANPTGEPGITPEEAADKLGITNEKAREAFLSVIEAFKEGGAKRAR